MDIFSNALCCYITAWVIFCPSTDFAYLRAHLPHTMPKHVCQPPCHPALTLLQSNWAWARLSTWSMECDPHCQIMNHLFFHLAIVTLLVGYSRSKRQLQIFSLLFIWTLFAAICLNLRWILPKQSQRFWRSNPLLPTVPGMTKHAVLGHSMEHSHQPNKLDSGGQTCLGTIRLPSVSAPMYLSTVQI